MAVHGGDVDRQLGTVVPAEVAEDHRREERAPRVAELALVAGAVPCVVDKVLHLRIALHNGERPRGQIPAYFHAVQLVSAPGERAVEQDGLSVVGRVIDPVSVFDKPHRLVGRA